MSTRPESGEKDLRSVTLPSVEDEIAHLSQAVQDVPTDAARQLLTNASADYIGHLTTYRAYQDVPPSDPGALEIAALQFRVAYERILIAAPIGEMYIEVERREGIDVARTASDEMARTLAEDYPEHTLWIREFTDSLFRD